MFRGTNDYPLGWPEISRQIKEQAAWRCVRCGHPDSPIATDDRPRGYTPCDEL